MAGGIEGLNLQEFGIPSCDQLIKRYCSNMNIESIDNFDFYMALLCFKMAAIIQGVYKRFLQGMIFGLVCLQIMCVDLIEKKHLESCNIFKIENISY